MKHQRLVFCAVFILAALLPSAFPALSAERIVVVGDSITGHSMNLPYGFAREIRAALEEAGSDVEFVPLGGSGQTIFSWRTIIANSYENNQRLDIEGIFVKEEFDKGADTILVHLGMNDALQPSIKSNEEGFASWKNEYVALVSDLRKRVPGVKRVILTPPTMLTEEFDSFKNLMMDRFAAIIKEVAEENNCEFVDTRKEFQDFVRGARFVDPDIRFTLDFVHPNQLGHQVMSFSFLKGLGLDEIAQNYYETKVDPKIKDFNSPGLLLTPGSQTRLIEGSFDIDALSICVDGITRGVQDVDVETIKVDSGSLKLEKIEKANAPCSFRLFLSGSSSNLPTTIKVKVGDLERSVLLNAPYFVATGYVLADGANYARPEDFPRDKAKTDVDAAIQAGKDPIKEIFSNPTSEEEFAWNMYLPTQFKTGADNPNAVDVACLSPANAFEGAYVVRYVRSPMAQKATLKLNSEGFSTTAIETIYLNGKEIYFDCLSPRHKKAVDQVEVELKEGINILAARIDHTFWQWAASFSFEDAEGLTF